MLKNINLSKQSIYNRNYSNTKQVQCVKSKISPDTMAEKSIKTCYICASTISNYSEESVDEKHVKTTRQILLKYLLKNRDKSKTLYNTIAKYISKRQVEDLLYTIQFCTSCDQRSEKVGRLLIQLNTIQNKIDKAIYETRRKVAGASKILLKSPDTDSSDSVKRKRNIKFFSTLRKFQKCVGDNGEPDSTKHDYNNVFQAESHETTANEFYEIAPKPENTDTFNQVVISDSRRTFDDDYIKEEVVIKVELDDEDVSNEEEEEVINCNTDSLSCSIDSLSSSESNDSNTSRTTSPPAPVVEVSNIAPSLNLPKATSFRPSSSTVNANELTSNCSRKRNLQSSSYLPLKKSHPSTHQQNPSQYLIVTQLEPPLKEDGSLPPPKIVPLKFHPEAPLPEEIIYESDSDSDSKDSTQQTTLKSKSGKRRLIDRCKTCSFTIGHSNFVLEHHLRSHETSLKRHTCAQCNMKFTTKQLYDLHLKFHSDKVHHKCDICKKPQRILGMKEHLSEVHQIDSISCPSCSYSFGKYYGLLSHSKWHGNTPIKCMICPNTVFKNRKLLANHFIEFHGIDETDVLFKCDKPECTKTFYVEYDKTLHMRKHEKLFKCPVCERCFGMAYELRKHSKLHSEECTFLCDLCSEKFRTKAALNTHQRKEHDAGRIQCDQCEKSFNSEAGFNGHKKYNHGVGDITPKLFPCPICGKKVRKKHSKNHLLTHSDTKDFVCSECGFQTKSKALLTDHQKRHFCQKTHQCPHCPKIFLTSQILKTHVRIHTKERPFVCDICGADFNQRSAMTSHRRRHVDTNFVPRGSRGASKKTPKRSN